MADKKISALTSSTTPLAGTEVLPIVQSGATVKVSVADLTAGRAVSLASLSAVGSGAGGLQTLATLNAASDAFSNSVEVALEPLVSGQSRTGIGAQREGVGTGAAVYLKAGGNEVLRGSVAGDVSVSIGNGVVSTAGKGFVLPGGISWTSGAGSPEGAVTAPVGSLYSRSDGGSLTSLYVKESGSGNTGWAGK